MSVLNNSNAISAGGAYNITDSLRFRRSANAYLSRTPASTGNRKTFTFSLWFKGKGYYTGNDHLIGVNTSSTSYARVYYGASGDNYLRVNQYVGGVNLDLITTQVLRDPSAWYHLVVAFDTTQATASNRIKMYLNGEQVTSFSTATYPSQNFDTLFNTTNEHRIGTLGATYNVGYEFDGYMAEVNFVDGQALTPSDFGETNADGVWSPKEYTGTYGTNGFYLPMKETTQATGFNTVLYTGNGTGQSINGVGFSPDFVWLKSRSLNALHAVFDTVRGGTKRLRTNDTVAEDTSTALTTFDSDGFTLGNDYSANNSGSTFVAWCWDAGSSTVSNTDGTITSSVRANPASGFSVVTYTGNGVAGATVGHGLSSAPKMIILKNRSIVANWHVYHESIGATKGLILNLTNAEATATQFWNNTAPTSSVFSLGTYGGGNGSGNNLVAYCFSEVAGYSKFGSYTGNGSTSGPTVTTGFRPAWIMFKRTDNVNGWYIWDNTRTVNNPRGNFFKAETSDAENSADIVNFTDTGFEIISNSSAVNTSGGTYIYMAFADTRDYQWNFDSSGNKNNWTPNNINSNASSETTYDLMSDVPSLADEDTGNFATLNPNAIENVSAGGGTFSNANLTITAGAGGSDAIHPVASIGTYLIGKSYWEITIDNAGNGGNQTTYISIGKLGGGGVMFAYGKNGYSYDVGAGWVASDLPTYTTGDVIGVAFDQSTSSTQATLKWYKNGTLVGTKTASYNSSHPKEELTASCRVQYNAKFSFNFGQRPFKYTPPTGYKKLNTFNLPDSSITDGSQYMNSVLWTGTGTTTSFTSMGFSPDLVWLKRRDTTSSNFLVDSVRGASQALYANDTTAEVTRASAVTSFDSDGWSMGSDFNSSGGSYVTWGWRGSDSTAVSNTDGTITSTVSANTTSGFSVVTYTGNGTAGSTIGHGLGSVPSMIIVKRRNSTSSWITYHASLGNTGALYLESTTAFVTNSALWNNTSPSSSTFTIGSGGALNTNGAPHVAYCFAEVEGFSKFGSYTGNGSADGPFIYTGFRPKFVMIKNTSAIGFWQMIDNARDPYNVTDSILYANTNGAEATATARDHLSNGFKIRNTFGSENSSGATYIYMAFAENPFKNSLAR